MIIFQDYDTNVVHRITLLVVGCQNMIVLVIMGSLAHEDRMQFFGRHLIRRILYVEFLEKKLLNLTNFVQQVDERWPKIINSVKIF